MMVRIPSTLISCT